MIKELVNLTPHTIVLRDANGFDHEYFSMGVVRVDTHPAELEEVEGIPVPVASPTQFGEVMGLPEYEEGVVYIVSQIVATAYPREDLLYPGTGPKDGCIRNEKGHIKAVTRLIRSM